MGWRLEAFKAALNGRPEELRRFFMSNMVIPPDRNTHDFLETYKRSPRLAAATKIATDLASAEGKLYRIKPNGDKDEIIDHPFLDLMRRPNPMPFMTRAALWKAHELYLLIKGEGNSIIERDRAGYPIELWPIPTHWVLAIPRLGYSCYTIRNRDGVQMEVPAEDVFVQRQLDITDPYGRGLGDAEPVADEIETDEYMTKWAKKFFYNDATPPVLVSAPGITKDEQERFTASWNDRYRGLGNAHKMGMIPRDITIHKLLETQREMDFAESRKDLRDAVNSHFGVPPEIMGIVENSNRATATQAKIIYAENVLTPRLQARQDAINLQLLPAWGDDLIWEYNDIVPEDVEFQLQKANAGMEKAVMMVDEWREANGLDPLPDDQGQVIYLPFSSIPTKPSELTGNMRVDVDKTQPLIDELTLKSVKSSNLRRVQAAFRDRQRLLAAEERAARRSVGRFLDSQTEAVVSAMKSGRKDSREDFWHRINAMGGLAIDIDTLRRMAKEALGDLLDWAAQDEALERVLSPIWAEAFREGSNSMVHEFGINAVQAPELTEYLRKKGLRRVNDINETTREKLANALADGIEAGEGQAELIKRVQEYMPGIQKERAIAIANNEAHISLQAGSFEQMKYAGIKTKTWVTAGDEATRATHRAVNGMTIPINDKFPNGLLYPGDPEGDISETIRCRCDLIPGGF